MKRTIKNTILFFVIAMACTLVGHAQDTTHTKKAGAQSVIEEEIRNKNFSFAANWAIPANGSMQQLTGYYYLKVLGDSLVCYLPYFGDAYSPTMGGAPDVELNVSSAVLEYTITERKGGWDILIRPKDQLDVQYFVLTVFENGTASLNTNCTRRNSISFNGNME